MPLYDSFDLLDRFTRESVFLILWVFLTLEVSLCKCRSASGKVMVLLEQIQLERL